MVLSIPHPSKASMHLATFLHQMFQQLLPIPLSIPMPVEGDRSGSMIRSAAPPHLSEYRPER